MNNPSSPDFKDQSHAEGVRKKRRSSGSPKPVDIHVGSRVKLRRILLGLSQEKLGEAVKLTFQQIQKYERGANRIGASRIYELSKILNVPVSFFFDDMPKELIAASQPSQGLGDHAQAAFEPDPLSRAKMLDLVQTYYRISSPAVRKRLFELTKSLAAAFGA